MFILIYKIMLPLSFVFESVHIAEIFINVINL